jgi:hypothetical protein
MKALKLFLGLLFVSTSLIIVSCGEGGVGDSSPGDAVKSMAIDLQGENYNTVVDLYINKNGEELTDEEKTKIRAFLPSAKEEMDKKEGLKEVVIVEETISADGKTATVKSYLIYGNGDKSSEDEINLVKVNGNWRIEI